MKLFRRISVLALVLVLACLFSTSAFATGSSSLNDSRTRGYSGGVSATASLSIAQYRANAIFYVQNTDAVHNVFQIDMEYSYYNESGQWRRSTSSVTVNDSYDASLVAPPREIVVLNMEKATARYQATFGEYTGGPFDFDETLEVQYT